VLSTVICLVQGRSAGHQNRDDVEAVQKCQERILRAPAPTADDFDKLVRAAFARSRELKLKSSWEDPDAPKSAEQVAFRREVYGPIYEDTKGLALMRSIVEAPMPEEWSAVTGCYVFADHGSAADLRSIFTGLKHIESDGSTGYGTIAEGYGRQLGRILARPPEEGEDPALRAEVLKSLNGWLDDPATLPMIRGASLNAFFESDDVERVASWFKKALSAEVKDPCEVLRLLPSNLRLMRHKRFPPEYRERLRAEARRAVTEFVADPPAGVVSTTSERVRCLRSGVQVHLSTMERGDLDLLLPLMSERRASSWLGIDLLQQMRWSLQTLRESLDADGRGKLDGYFLGVLVADGAVARPREQPVGEEEKAAFFDRRDLRYNAASYLEEVLDKDGKSLIELIAGTPEAIETFWALITAGMDAGSAQVREKLENSVVLAEVAAKLRADFEEEIDRATLQKLLLGALRNELGDPERDPAEPPLTVNQKRKPQDPFIKDHLVSALKALGLHARESADSIDIE
jgi:hypothetical protein